MKRVLSAFLVFCLTLMMLPVMPITSNAANELNYAIENGEVTITSNMFSNLTGDLIIPDTIEGYPVTKIGEEAFSYCKDLTSVKIPDSVTIIDKKAFSQCEKLLTVEFGSGLKTIGESAFKGCYVLSALDLPEGVSTIGESAFSHCVSLNIDLILPDSVTSLGELAFCLTGLKSVTFGKGLTSIGKSAFFGSGKITSVTFDGCSVKIEMSAFEQCDYIREVHITDMAAWCGCEVYGYASNPMLCARTLYLNGELLKDAVIPDGVTRIGSGTFERAYLTSVTIPESVTSIGTGAFNWCGTMEKVYYAGDEAQWEAIDIEMFNDELLNAEIVYNYGAAIPGDLNGDEQIDNNDVSYLLWYTLFPEDYPISADADYNGDEIVNNEDVAYLLWHTLFPEDYPL